MKWMIPAKTFLLGEYAALAIEPAILLTTRPCFEISLSNSPGLHGIHPASPAGQFWLQQNVTDIGLQWYDPYEGKGGVGASSAQFVGAYAAAMHIQHKPIDTAAMLAAYLKCAWSGEGTAPSGYDVVAQSLQGCVYIDRKNAIYEVYSWPFKDIGFLLLHTGQKLATHEHLQKLALPNQIKPLVSIVDMARQAFIKADSQLIVACVNNYYEQLKQLHLVAEQSLRSIETLKENDDILAIKGCGALGADVLLLLVPMNKLASMKAHFLAEAWTILGTNYDLYPD